MCTPSDIFSVAATTASPDMIGQFQFLMLMNSVFLRLVSFWSLDSSSGSLHGLSPSCRAWWRWWWRWRRCLTSTSSWCMTKKREKSSSYFSCCSDLVTSFMLDTCFMLVFMLDFILLDTCLMWHLCCGTYVGNFFLTIALVIKTWSIIHAFEWSCLEVGGFEWMEENV